MGDVVADGEKAKETAELPLEVSDSDLNRCRSPGTLLYRRDFKAIKQWVAKYALSLCRS